jgi:hypothetical protein
MGTNRGSAVEGMSVVSSSAWTQNLQWHPNQATLVLHALCAGCHSLLCRRCHLGTNNQVTTRLSPQLVSSATLAWLLAFLSV